MNIRINPFYYLSWNLLPLFDQMLGKTLLSIFAESKDSTAQINPVLTLSRMIASSQSPPIIVT
ncbi:hypothetical protein [Coleofasciculus sp. G2-EDA-02]|uniref:hypothetical protein n=1 Tax=Coleofasciculus sp. G2-EDA-02 TaxID=3069529 RepID=UPI003300F37E